MKINSAYSPNEVNSRMGWDLNWYKWGSLSSLCYPVQHWAGTAETGGDSQGWAEVQPCHPAAVLWWGASSKGPRAALSVNCAGHLQASAILWFNLSSWVTQEKGFWMLGWQAGRRSVGSLVEWVVTSFVLLLSVPWQYQPPVGEASLVSAVFLCLAMPTQLLGSVLASWGQGWVLWDKKQQVQNKVLFTCPWLEFVPRVSGVGTVLMLPAVIKKTQTKKKNPNGHAVVQSRAAHLLSKAGPWEHTSAPILLVGCRLLHAARERFQPPAAAPRLTWEPTSPSSHPSPPDNRVWLPSHRPMIYVVWNSAPSEIEMAPRFATSNIKCRDLLPYLLTLSSSGLSFSSLLSEGAMKATNKYSRSFLLVLSITIFTC